MKPAFEVREFSRETWPDFEALFGKHKGVRGGTPVAWCQFGPDEGFPRYERGRAYGKLFIPANLAPRWRISCLFVDKHRRKEGLSKFALKAAMDSIRKRGGGVVEAFPLDVPGAKYPPYTRSIEMYRREGFEEVARLGTSTVLMRRVVGATGG